jgi:glutathione S-transferase
VLKIHHLVLSRSERIVWLAEELGLKYELVRHARVPQSFRSPESLRQISPLGKAPVIQDGSVTVCESAAIVEYLLDHYGNGTLRPGVSSAEFLEYRYWIHSAESTLMVPVLFDMLGGMAGLDSPILSGFVSGEYKTMLDFVDQTLERHEFVAGASFTAADIMVGYTLRLGSGRAVPGMAVHAPLDAYPRIVGYLDTLEARPAFEKAMALLAG